MIDIHEFVTSIKCSWIKRYTLGRLDDHWTDMLDIIFNLTMDTRLTLLTYGPERFNNIIKLNLPGISSLFSSYKTLKFLLPSDPSCMDNTWLTQPIFFNLNFTRAVPNSKKLACLKPTFYGISDNFHTITVEQMYPGGSFIGKNALEDMIGAQIIPLSYIGLKSHIKSKIGPNKKYNGVPLRCPKDRIPKTPCSP